MKGRRERREGEKRKREEGEKGRGRERGRGKERERGRGRKERKGKRERERKGKRDGGRGREREGGRKRKRGRERKGKIGREKKEGENLGRGRKTHREGPNTPSATNTESIMSFLRRRRGRERRRWKESLVLREEVEEGIALSGYKSFPAS